MDSPPNVPYQAYKSKRHSRVVSSIHLVPNVSPPPMSRPSSITSITSSIPAPTFTRPHEYYESESEKVSTEYPGVITVVTDKTQAPSVDIVHSKDLPSSPAVNDSPTTTELPSPASINVALPDPVQAPVPDEPVPRTNGKDKEIELPIVSPASSVTKLPAASPKPSRFRRLRPPAAKSPLASPLRPPITPSPVPSTSSRQLDALHSPLMHSRVTSVTSVISDGGKLPPPVLLRGDSSPFPQNSVSPPPRSSSMVTPLPPPKVYSPTPTPAPLPPASTSAPVSAAASGSASPAASIPSLPSTSSAPASSSAHIRTSTPARSAVPYRAGFQPKGVYRPRTDEFAEYRRKRADEGRIERTKLERRLEKLIALHFPVENSNSVEKGVSARKDEVSVNGRGLEKRRASSFFNLDLKNMDAGELWKGVLHGQMIQGSVGDTRAAEQRITPWQDDAAVSKCPLCIASFHPLTNRKHHCRLCGTIICSLPPKLPQRQSPCSVLFVVDAKTRRIEEVGEGVDYGVRRAGAGEEEKFLRGVRICRSCRPVLTRQQYWQEMASVPPFVKFYDAFISLEKEIEDAIPQFQDLLLTLSNDDQPTKEASAARKRLLDAFAQYDAFAKRIHAIPCNTGSSQNHVQLAVLNRANLFLQKHMFPLQSLPKAKKRDSTSSPVRFEAPLVDPDSDLAHTLQPLLEQEALLESFVGEAMAHRKFEDAKTLKANLAEIRAEIDRMLGDGVR